MQQQSHHSHRASLKQRNKPFKGSSSTPANKKGRTAKRTPVKSTAMPTASKQDRLNMSKQAREKKRQEILEHKRMGAASSAVAPPPKIVMLLPFHRSADALAMKRRILEACEVSDLDNVAPHKPVTVLLPTWAQPTVPGESKKQRITIIDPPPALYAALDVAKCADVIVAAFCQGSLERPAFDEDGYEALSALRLQGLPPPVGVMGGVGQLMWSAKKVAENKRFVTRYFHSEFGDDKKLFDVDSDQDVRNLLRHLANVTPKPLKFREDRGYLMSNQVEYDAATQTLAIAGYVRGVGFTVRHPVHLTGHGDFQLEKIVKLPDPCPTQGTTRRQERHKEGGMAVDTDAGAGGGTEILEQMTPEIAAGLDEEWKCLRPYDPFAGEQTWPTDQEMAAAEKAMKSHKAHRIGAPVREEDENGGEFDDMIDDNDEQNVDQEHADEHDDDAHHEHEAEWDEGDDPSDAYSSLAMPEETDEDMQAERARLRQIQMEERSREDMMFPDEVDTPADQTARHRFQKYRGLKSFRTSAWDPYEKLPIEYSRIHDFEAIKATMRSNKRHFRADCSLVGGWGGGGISGLYCCIYLRNVPASVLASHPSDFPLIVSSLFGYERKVSVLHMSLTRVDGAVNEPPKDGSSSSGGPQPLPSKETVELHCGFRRFPGRPAFSQHVQKHSQDKFKYERFMHPGTTCVASLYAPTIFTPSPALMFRMTQDGESRLCAWGSVMAANPNRLLIKRIVLTGYPFRVHKTKAVVRYMFFDPDDVKWFKPVELHTKKGLRGHISEPLGTHGYMKCRFSSRLDQSDTVCMYLYKRVFPKWYPPSWGGDATKGPADHHD
ncbi:unnamed protein product [Vitrella brassicaformis CCMP3155]|uniref:Bms1-type G domain-containing protein n=2 Tax=Vitrella brassicaformis TaxID=1169539 RepID=A0A0G4E8F5_VITBC|nr:unnamed protein product [Vitrella brassicaformis CCMP3155]|eukprot:CEL91593.1 unnamed protein product [Vitrella brassicaformis CCMP3155]